MISSNSITPAPLSAYLILTYRCNLHCPFCYENSLRFSDYEEFSTESWFRVIDELQKLKVFKLTITGGEIFTLPDIWDILNKIKQNKMRFKLITNGTLLDENAVEHLAMIHHCDSVQISIDGLEEYHDSIRGTGMFQKTIDTIQLLAKYNIPVSINTVITAQNYHQILKIASFFETLPIFSYRLFPVTKTYSNSYGINNDFSLTLKQLAQLTVDLVANQNNFPKLNKKAGILSSYHKIFSFHKDDKKIFEKCSNVNFSFAINPDGTVSPCAGTIEPIMGDLHNSSIEEIWNSTSYQNFRNKHECGIKLVVEKCKHCKYAFYCRAYCPALEKQEKICLKEFEILLQEMGLHND